MKESEYRVWIGNLIQIISMRENGCELHPAQEGIIHKTRQAVKKWDVDSVCVGGQPPALKPRSQGDNECSQHHTHKVKLREVSQEGKK